MPCNAWRIGFWSTEPIYFRSDITHSLNLFPPILRLPLPKRPGQDQPYHGGNREDQHHEINSSLPHGPIIMRLAFSITNNPGPDDSASHDSASMPVPFRVFRGSQLRLCIFVHPSAFSWPSQTFNLQLSTFNFQRSTLGKACSQ